MNLEEAIKKILTGNCVLFTGAGFSYGAENMIGNSPMAGTILAKHLYKECNISESDDNLKSASEFYIEKHGQHQLIEFLKREYSISKPSDNHEYIASLPWKRIYTTNYDNLFETASSKIKKLITPITMSDILNYYKDKKTLCIHLNGFIDRLTPASLNKEFKLTDTSYLTTDFVNSRWVSLFRDDLKSSSVILFIGFSMNNDLDLSRVINVTTGKHDNVFFIVKKDESDLNIRKLERYGTPLAIGIDGIASEIKMIKNYYTPPEIIETDFISFSKYSINYPVPTLKDIDIWNLFFKGEIKEEIIHYSLTDSSKFIYYIRRNKIEEIIDKIKSGNRNFLLHSDLGNGKTLFLNGLASELSKQEYNVFMFKKYYENVSNEIEKICTSIERAVIIFENYSSHFDILEKVSLHRTNDVTVIVSERSTINDTVYPTLEDIIFSDKYIVRDLNILDDIEIDIMSSLLTHYGLWGKYTSKSKELKRNLLINECKRSFRLILLLLIDSLDIKNRFNNILSKIKNSNNAFFDAVLLILASNIFDFNLDLDDLIYILDDELLNNPAFYDNDYLMEIIDFQYYTIKAKSSVLSESLLVRNEFHNELINVLIKVVKKLDEKRNNRNYLIILKSIENYARLQTLFNLNENPKLKPLILNFFEEIKDTGFARNNPYFWLQYAIARLSSRDYIISGKYFATAYSLAEKSSDFDTYQIDNHYARHILENEIYNGTIDTCMEQFLKAHNILSTKNNKELHRHYPFRVALLYGKFYNSYYDQINEQEKKIFISSCKDILFKIDEYKKITNENRWHKYVITCEKELKAIINTENDKK